MHATPGICGGGIPDSRWPARPGHLSYHPDGEIAFDRFGFPIHPIARRATVLREFIRGLPNSISRHNPKLYRHIGFAEAGLSTSLECRRRERRAPTNTPPVGCRCTGPGETHGIRITARALQRGIGGLRGDRCGGGWEGWVRPAEYVSEDDARKMQSGGPGAVALDRFFQGESWRLFLSRGWDHRLRRHMGW